MTSREVSAPSEGSHKSHLDEYLGSVHVYDFERNPSEIRDLIQSDRVVLKNREDVSR